MVLIYDSIIGRYNLVKIGLGQANYKILDGCLQKVLTQLLAQTSLLILGNSNKTKGKPH